MYIPRRHYRHLLLPPGWVALGLLLLLECQALLTHERQMRLPNVLQLTMPSLQQDTSRQGRSSENYDMPYRPVNKLDSARPWHDAEFAGAHLSDFVNLATTENFVRAIHADTKRGGGVRIRFHSHATYANLVSALDLMERLNQGIYWLDIRYTPITLYAITNEPIPVNSTRQLVFNCGIRYSVIPTPTAVLSFKQILDGFWQQSWRSSTLLLMIISALSFYRLARPRPIAR
jgi:hypothetical protein